MELHSIQMFDENRLLSILRDMSIIEIYCLFISGTV
jgi:hypothetical protein